MLRYVPKKTFKSDVNVELPSGDKGSFECEFTHLNREQLDALIDRGLGDRELLNEILVGVSKIVGEDGKELEPDVQKELVLSDLALSNRATTRFLEVLGGAAKGNSPRLRVR